MSEETKSDSIEENGELYEHFKFVVDKGQGSIRVDKFLVSKIENASRNKIQSTAKAGNILVNDSPAKSNYKIKPEDIITIVMSYPPVNIELKPEDIPLNIVYEDDDLLIVNKEPGMVVHPGHGNFTGTLVNALAYHLKDLPMFKTGELRPGIVHRIDKNTSGIMLVAKTEIAANKLAKQFFDRTINRKYIALVWGTFKETTGTITGNIGRAYKDRKRMDVFPEGDFGKHAVTHYKVIEELGYISVVECKLETGRTHQIRVHFEHISRPIFNDGTYSGDKVMKGTTFTKYKQFVHNCFKQIPRHALHAKSLEFTHPTTGETMFFDSELPQDMQITIEKWRNYTDNRDI